MRKTLLVLAAGALALSAATASAQPRPYGDRDRDGVPNRVDRDRDGDGIPNRADPNPNRYGAGHRWTRGQRLDSRWHDRRYMVSDWRTRGWRAPPRGYAYYRTDNGDVVMAAVATGIISSVLANALSH